MPSVPRPNLPERPGMLSGIASMHVHLSREQRKFLVGLERSRFGRRHRLLVNYVREIFDDDLLGMAAELSYRWLFALFPVMIMLAAISRFVAEQFAVQDPTSDLIDAVGAQLPPETAAAIKPQLEPVTGDQSGVLLSLGLLLTIYAASSGMKALIKGLNKAYDLTEVRSFQRRLLLAFALTLLIGTSVVVFFVLLLGGEQIAHDVASAFGVSEFAIDLFGVLCYPFAIVALAAATAVVYHVAPACDVRWRSVLPGVTLFVTGWIATTIGFGVYITDLSSYGETYGSISGIIILPLWLYVGALLLLLGGELNATIEQYREAQQARKLRLAERREELIAERLSASTVAEAGAASIAAGRQ